MISSKRKGAQMSKEEKNVTDGFDLQFKKMIKDIIKEERYFNPNDIKELVDNILVQVEPMIAKYVKIHFNEIGKYIVNLTNNSNNNEDNNAKTS